MVVTARTKGSRVTVVAFTARSALGGVVKNIEARRWKPIITFEFSSLKKIPVQEANKTRGFVMKETKAKAKRTLMNHLEEGDVSDIKLPLLVAKTSVAPAKD